MTACPNSSSSKLPTTRPTGSTIPTWSLPGRHSTRLPPATTLMDVTHRPCKATSSEPPALTTRLFVTKARAPALGNVVPDTTKEPIKPMVTEVFATRAPAALPSTGGIPPSLLAGHPAALQPGGSPTKLGSHDELDRVVSMYYDRYSVYPAAIKNWL